MIKRWCDLTHEDHGKDAIVSYPINIEQDVWAEVKGIIKCPTLGKMPLLLVGLYEVRSYLHKVQVEVIDDQG